MTGEAAENGMSYEYTLLEKFTVSRFPVLHQKCNLKTFQKLEKKKTKQESALAQNVSHILRSGKEDAVSFQTPFSPPTTVLILKKLVRLKGKPYLPSYRIR